MSEPEPYSRIAVLGAGAWGSALALTLLAAGRDTILWVREDDVLATIKSARQNRFLPGATLPEKFKVTGELGEAAKAEARVRAVPAHVLRAFTANLVPHTSPGTPLVVCAKGIEKDTSRLLV